MTTVTEPRIVCLVPSVTELLCDLGLSGQLVGCAGSCAHPREAVRGIPELGGTTDVDLEKVRELGPTHAVVGVGENAKEIIEALAELVPEVVITHPRAPRDNLGLYWQLGAVFDREAEAERLCSELLRACARPPHGGARLVSAASPESGEGAIS
jgi:ABC-type Fe3+-hydroxamate transport system substrate-binding protein